MSRLLKVYTIGKVVNYLYLRCDHQLDSLKSERFKSHIFEEQKIK